MCEEGNATVTPAINELFMKSRRVTVFIIYLPSEFLYYNTPVVLYNSAVYSQFVFDALYNKLLEWLLNFFLLSGKLPEYSIG